MRIRTAFTEMMGVQHPLALAPMGWISGGALAAAVSNAGGIGIVGGGYGERDWLARELALVKSTARGKWGVGLITWHTNQEMVGFALSFQPDVFCLFFGDPSPYVPAIKHAGCKLICQVHDVEPARQAKALGADIIVAQGAESGGHGALRATLPLVPLVVDAVAPTPVLAAGGIGDGRGLAAALALGAAGVLVGTRFCAAQEALTHPGAKQRYVSARGSDTLRTKVFDTARGYTWPEPYTGRAVKNEFLQKWHTREAALANDAQELKRYYAAAQAGDFNTALVHAGEVVDMITAIEPAADIVARMVQDAENWLRRAPALLA